MTVQTTCFLYLTFLSLSHVHSVKIDIWCCVTSQARLTIDTVWKIIFMKAIYRILWMKSSIIGLSDFRSDFFFQCFIFFIFKHITDANLEPKHLTGLTQLEKYKWLMVAVTWRWIALSLKVDTCLQKVMQSQITKLISHLMQSLSWGKIDWLCG